MLIHAPLTRTLSRRTSRGEGRSLTTGRPGANSWSLKPIGAVELPRCPSFRCHRSSRDQPGPHRIRPRLGISDPPGWAHGARGRDRQAKPSPPFRGIPRKSTRMWPLRRPSSRRQHARQHLYLALRSEDSPGVLVTPPGCVHIFDGFLPPRPAIFVEPAVLTSCVFALCCQPLSAPL